MSVSSGVSDGVEDRVDAFVLSSIMSRVVGSVPHARPGAREFFLGGVLWKTVLYALTYVAGFACGWFLLFDQDQDWVRMRIGQATFPVLFSIFAVTILLGRYEDGKGRPGPWFVVLCVVPSWMLAKATGSAGASLFWCCVVGVVGALWFVLDMWAIEKCASTHRDAAFEWLAAWALVFDLIVLIASLLGASNDDDDASR